jgi:hypothetical protein
MFDVNTGSSFMAANATDVNASSVAIASFFFMMSILLFSGL